MPEETPEQTKSTNDIMNLIDQTRVIACSERNLTQGEKQTLLSLTEELIKLNNIKEQIATLTGYDDPVRGVIASNQSKRQLQQKIKACQDKVNHLYAEIDNMQDEADQLKITLNKLPVTEDGMSVVPGVDTIWQIDPEGTINGGDPWEATVNDQNHLNRYPMYSTKQALLDSTLPEKEIKSEFQKWWEQQTHLNCSRETAKEIWYAGYATQTVDSEISRQNKTTNNKER